MSCHLTWQDVSQERRPRSTSGVERRSPPGPFRRAFSLELACRPMVFRHHVKNPSSQEHRPTSVGSGRSGRPLIVVPPAAAARRLRTRHPALAPRLHRLFDLPDEQRRVLEPLVLARRSSEWMDASTGASRVGMSPWSRRSQRHDEPTAAAPGSPGGSPRLRERGGFVRSAQRSDGPRARGANS